MNLHKERTVKLVSIVEIYYRGNCFYSAKNSLTVKSATIVLHALISPSPFAPIKDKVRNKQAR